MTAVEVIHREVTNGNENPRERIVTAYVADLRAFAREGRSGGARLALDRCSMLAPLVMR